MFMAVGLFAQQARSVKEVPTQYRGTYNLLAAEFVGGESSVDDVRFMQITSNRVHMFYGDTRELRITDVRLLTENGINYMGLVFHNRVRWIVNFATHEGIEYTVVRVHTNLDNPSQETGKLLLIKNKE